VEAAALQRINLPELQPHLCVVFHGAEELADLWCGGSGIRPVVFLAGASMRWWRRICLDSVALELHLASFDFTPSKESSRSWIPSGFEAGGVGVPPSLGWRAGCKRGRVLFLWLMASSPSPRWFLQGLRCRRRPTLPLCKAVDYALMRNLERFGSTPDAAIPVMATAGEPRPGLPALQRALSGICQGDGDLCKRPEEEEDLRDLFVICCFVRGLRVNCLFVLCFP
jgi:hypothetical protein